MTIRVKSTGGTKGLNVFQYLTADSKAELNRRAAALVDQRVKQKVTAHYKNAVEMVGAALAGIGMSPSITTSGSKRIAYLKAEGGSGYINTTTWEALSEKYLNPDAHPTWWVKKEPGTPFWHNRGGLADAYLDLVLGGRIQVKKGRTKVSPASKAGRFRMVTTWQFMPLGDPYADALIRGPFATGNESAQDTLTMEVSGDMWKLWINEKGRWGAPGSPYYKGRPWVARLAATLGKQMRTSIRKLA